MGVVGYYNRYYYSIGYNYTVYRHASNITLYGIYRLVYTGYMMCYSKNLTVKQAYSFSSSITPWAWVLASVAASFESKVRKAKPRDLFRF